MHSSNTQFSYIIILFIFILGGCSRHFQHTIDTIYIGSDLKNISQVNIDTIRTLPYSSSLVSVNNTPPILMVLGNIQVNPENHSYRLTWFGNDKSTLTTENGRIIHTVGFLSNNLDNLLSPSPLPFPNATGQWQAIYDWSPGYRYNFTAQVTSQSLGLDTIKTELWKQTAVHIQETVHFPSLNSQFNNNFWVAPGTQHHNPFVVKSIQYIGPSMDRVEMVMIKPYLEFKQTPAQKQDATKDSL